MNSGSIAGSFVASSSVATRELDTAVAWYAAQLRPNGDAMALVNLQRQGFNAFRPLLWETKRSVKGPQRLLRPMFPGYIFVEFDIRQPQWTKIRCTRGISRLVGNINEGPSRLPSGLIDMLKQRCAGNLADSAANALQPGDNVYVASGPFAAFLATVERMDAKNRVWLLIDFMGRASRFSADADQLVPQRSYV
ncbi:MAG: transcription termination/antitermination NusG family protein [Pseudomonadota bacterium]